MESVRDDLQVIVRRLDRLQAICCMSCCCEEVSLTQSHILFEIRRMGNPSMQGVAEELGVDITTFSRQAKSLEGQGLITRRVSPDDRRVHLLGLTEKGAAVLAGIDLHMSEQLAGVFSNMTPFEQECVSRSLGLLASAVQRNTEEKAGNLRKTTKTG